MKILDCTLRDGGYYTNWGFDEKLVHQLTHVPYVDGRAARICDSNNHWIL